MNFKLKRPCDSCPFVRGHKFPLTPARVDDIEAHVDGGFSCHKTVDYSKYGTAYDLDDEYAERVRVPGKQEQHCAGSLILQAQEYNMCFGKMPALAAAMGMWDPHDLDIEGSDVFASWAEMREANERGHTEPSGG